MVQLLRKKQKEEFKVLRIILQLMIIMLDVLHMKFHIFKCQFQAVVTKVLDGGIFYVQVVADQKVCTIQQQLASLNIRRSTYNTCI